MSGVGEQLMRNRGFEAHVDLCLWRQKIESYAVDAGNIIFDAVNGRQEQMVNWRCKLRAAWPKKRSKRGDWNRWNSNRSLLSF